MPIYDIELLSTQEVAQKTYLFKFSKPENFHFKAGQYGGFTLINPNRTDEKGVTRRFSILNSPNDPNLEVMTRDQGSAFKESLIQQKPGSRIKFAGPAGKFILPEATEQPIILLAGGMGIAPFYSMLRLATQNHSEQKFHLFYADKNIHTLALMTELQELIKENQNISLTPILEHAPTDWPGETGCIRHELILQYCKNHQDALFYVCGSPKMVAAMRHMLDELNINKESVLYEDFPGY